MGDVLELFFSLGRQRTLYVSRVTRKTLPCLSVSQDENFHVLALHCARVRGHDKESQHWGVFWKVAPRPDINHVGPFNASGLRKGGPRATSASPKRCG